MSFEQPDRSDSQDSSESDARPTDGNPADSDATKGRPKGDSPIEPAEQVSLPQPDRSDPQDSSESDERPTDGTPAQNDQTTDRPESNSPIEPADLVSFAFPYEKLGRYLIKECLGSGGFGDVYLAFDPELERDVAIKIPKKEKLANPDIRRSFVKEARAAGQFQHPGLVRVLDSQTENDPIYIVMEYLPGKSLEFILTKQRLLFENSVWLLIQIAEAIHCAHEQDLVHRDLKPQNVILNASGMPVVTDFGLAIESLDFGARSDAVVGTPRYMSPEQMRGETHRIDRRTDIWALGVILYRALTRRLPFTNPDQVKLYQEIQLTEPTRPRAIEPSVPRELERICLRCLSKLMGDRYATADELAGDLRAWLASAQQLPRSAQPPAIPVAMEAARPDSQIAESETSLNSVPGTGKTQSFVAEVRIVPRGLGHFEASDTEFFLNLLPGALDRNGLPPIVRQWKESIESKDPARQFPVGLLYGPSGCGKSSILRAGLLPRLDPRVHSIIIEATADETEQQLRRTIIHRFRNVPQKTLPEMLFHIRERHVLPDGEKLLIVIDQFEQWLNANSPDASQELVQALRQCDSEHIQVLLLVRDDFALAAVRFLQALEVQLVQGQNYGICDLLTKTHARRVLKYFGQAYDQLPYGELTADQKQFIERAVDSMAENGRVVAVRLSLFAEMMRHHSWTTSSFKEMGGAEGVGIAFLEECFGVNSFNPRLRILRRPASALLRALLPATGTVLKGHSLTVTELKSLTRMNSKPIEFDELIRILDGELRLISPVISDEDSDLDSREANAVRETSYHLTHDYLVPVLRKWFERQEEKSFRGRTRIMLERRTEVWAGTHEVRDLPTALQLLRIRCLLRTSEFNPVQREMLAKATRRHVLRAAVLASVLMVCGLVGFQLWKEQQADIAKRMLTSRVEQVLSADDEHVGDLINALPLDSIDWAPQFQRHLENSDAVPTERWRAQLALARIQPSVASDVINSLANRDVSEIKAIVSAAKHWSESVNSQLWELAHELRSSPMQLRIACLLAQLDHSNPKWKEIRAATSRSLLSEGFLRLGDWVQLLRPVHAHLREPLADLCKDMTLSASQRTAASQALVACGDTDLDRLVLLVMVSTAEQFPEYLKVLRSNRLESVRRLRAIVDQTTIQGLAYDSELAIARKGMAILTLISLGESDRTWSELAGSPDPRLRTWLIDRLPRYGVTSEVLWAERSKQPDGLVRQALVLMLDSAWPNDLRSRNKLVEELSSLVRTATDARERSAAEWVLRHQNVWDSATAEIAVTANMRQKSNQHEMTWTRNSLGNVLVKVQPAEFTMGSPSSEGGRDKDEEQCTVAVTQPFWVAVHEVTVDEFKRFRPDVDYAAPVSPSRECPMSNVSWLHAVAYCRWLSEQEGLPEDQMVYPSLATIMGETEWSVDPSYLRRSGYRLPTEAEWELAARAGTTTARFFGEKDDFGHDYACYLSETLTPIGTFRPNQFGLFDILGNVGEWCHSDWVDYHSVRQRAVFELAQSSFAKSHRGFAYKSPSREVRSARRLPGSVTSGSSVTGFRIFRTATDAGK